MTGDATWAPRMHAFIDRLDTSCSTRGVSSIDANTDSVCRFVIWVAWLIFKDWVKINDLMKISLSDLS